MRPRMASTPLGTAGVSLPAIRSSAGRVSTSVPTPSRPKAMIWKATGMPSSVSTATIAADTAK